MIGREIQIGGDAVTSAGERTSAAQLLNSPAAVTAVGSFPGTDVWEASAVIRGELPLLPLLPELPSRGPGADMIGRTLGILATVSSELAAVTTPTGWRLSGQTTSALPAVMRRSTAWLNEDLDAAQSHFAEFTGCYKVQLVGPWTLAACLELRGGDRVLRDRGAVADLHEALAQAATDHLRELRRRLPLASFLMQFDEPLLNRVLEGSVPTPSGFAAYAPVEEPVAGFALSKLTAAMQRVGTAPGIHSCAADVWLDLLRSSGFEFVSCDVTLASSFDRNRREQFDTELGELLDAGRMLFAGLSTLAATQAGHPAARASSRSRPIEPSATLEPLTAILSRLGIAPESVLNQLVLTSTCGFAGAGSLATVRAATSELAAAGRALRDERVGNEEGSG